MNQWWNDIWNGSYMSYGYEIKWSYDPRSYERNFCNNLHKEAWKWKIHDFNGVWTRDLAMPVWRSNQLIYELCGYETNDFISAVHIWSFSYIISSLTHSSWEHWNPRMTSSQCKWLHSSVGYSVTPVSRGHRFKPCWSPEFFRLLYAIAKIVFITVRIIASFDFISAVHIIMIHFIYHFIIDLFPTGTLEPTNDHSAPNISGFIHVAQLVRASHWYREVTGSNPVEVLNFSGFFTQLQKLRP